MNKKLVGLFAAVMSVSLLVSGCTASQGTGTVSTETETSVSTSLSVSTSETQTSVSKEDTSVSTSTSEEPVASVSAGSTEIDEEPEKTYLPLRDAVKQTIDGYMGCCLNSSTINDKKIWAIVTEEFSAVTFENELKPQSLFPWGSNPGTLTTAKVNGKKIDVPKLRFTTADTMCDKILKWNKENPDREIKIKGHVLVWHAQTPEYFFHEDYDKSKPLVDTKTMNLRLEWYIKTVLEHYCGEDSKYKGLFYGWDVVNEAVADNNGKYRTDAMNANESASADYHNNNSTWWAVYQSEEYIINAFKYANKYAPADVELYYNDYGECSSLKRTGIKNLLKAVKEEEGEPGVGTRIDGMGMQGHYNVNDPGFGVLTMTMEMYAAVVGKVEISEFDMSDSNYDSSSDKKEEELAKIEKQYRNLYNEIKRVEEKGTADVTGITFWGVTDKFSWLQNSSNLGGGNTTGLKQAPLLYDEKYERKSCYYVFAEVE